MLTKKGRKIANLEAKVKNRDNLIEYLEDELINSEKIISQIRVIANSNNYGKPEVYLRTIKELVRPQITTNSK